MQVLIDVRINPEEGYEKICEVITEVNETLKRKVYRKYSNWARYFWYGRFRQWQLCGANDHVCTKRQTICGQRRISSSIYQSINRGRFLRFPIRPLLQK